MVKKCKFILVMSSKRMAILFALMLYFFMSKKDRNDFRKQKQVEMLRFILERNHGIDVGCLCTDGFALYNMMNNTQNHFVYSCQDGKWIFSKRGVWYCSDAPEIRVSQRLKTQATSLSMVPVLLKNFFKGYRSSTWLHSSTMARVLHKTSTPIINFSVGMFGMKPFMHGLRPVAPRPRLCSFYFCDDANSDFIIQNYAINNFAHSLVANGLPLNWKEIVRILHLCFTQNWRLEMQDAGLLGLSCIMYTETQWCYFSLEIVLQQANKNNLFSRTFRLYVDGRREEIKKQLLDERNDAVSSIINSMIAKVINPQTQFFRQQACIAASSEQAELDPYD